MQGDLGVANPFAALLAPGERLLWTGAPSAGGLFLANLAGILGTLIWAALSAAALVYAIGARQEAGFAATGMFLVIALYAFYRNVRAALGARHVRYAITADRILSVDNRDAAPFIVLRGEPEDRMREAWLDGRAKRGWQGTRGRATVKIPFTSYQLGTGKIPDGFQHDWLRFTSVERADAAVAMLNGAG